MKIFLSILPIAGVITLVDLPTAEAATFVARASGVGCEEFVSESSPVSATCEISTLGLFEAEAFSASGGGTVSAFASSYGSRSSGGTGGIRTLSGPAESNASLFDTILVSWTGTGNLLASGSAVFTLDMLGNVQSDELNSESGQAIVRSSFQVNGTGLFDYDSGTASFGPDIVTNASVNMTDGNLRLISSAYAFARSCETLKNGESCSAEANLGSSLRIIGLSFFDGSGQDITNLLTIASESGFDYVAGASPHDRGESPNVIPLPASLPTALLGFLMLAAIARRKKKTAE
jgi:hypothetical protein